MIETTQKWAIDKRGCLYLLPSIPDKSIDMIITDLPYGLTNCAWDTAIPFEPLWEQYKRIIKDDGAIVLFGTQPFTSALIMSNPKMFKYEWIWGKSKCGSQLAAKYRPMAKHENIMVFGKGKTKYNPDMVNGEAYKRDFTPHNINNHKFGIKGAKANNKGTRYPDTILFFQQKWRRQDQIHPTRKPVGLAEYLIKTYSNKGDMVHDSCLGFGTTLEACVNTNRSCIGFEISDEWEWNYRKILDKKKNVHKLSKLFGKELS